MRGFEGRRTGFSFAYIGVDSLRFSEAFLPARRRQTRRRPNGTCHSRTITKQEAMTPGSIHGFPASKSLSCILRFHGFLLKLFRSGILWRLEFWNLGFLGPP